MKTCVNDRVVGPNIHVVQHNAHGLRKVTFAEQDMGQVNLLGVEKCEPQICFLESALKSFQKIRMEVSVMSSHLKISQWLSKR